MAESTPSKLVIHDSWVRDVLLVVVGWLAVLGLATVVLVTIW